jgi:hypothetical protein
LLVQLLVSLPVLVLLLLPPPQLYNEVQYRHSIAGDARCCPA